MPNPLYQQLNGAPTNPLGKFKRDFAKFREQFQGDPRETVQKMLQSGQITQEQLNQAQMLANQLKTML